MSRRFALCVLLAGDAALRAADSAHWGGVYMTWLFERVTVNKPEEA